MSISSQFILFPLFLQFYVWILGCATFLFLILFFGYIFFNKYDKNKWLNVKSLMIKRIWNILYCSRHDIAEKIAELALNNNHSLIQIYYTIKTATRSLIFSQVEMLHSAYVWKKGKLTMYPMFVCALTTSFNYTLSLIEMKLVILILIETECMMDHCDCDRMVVGFTTINAISAYHC